LADVQSQVAEVNSQIDAAAAARSSVAGDLVASEGRLDAMVVDLNRTRLQLDMTRATLQTQSWEEALGLTTIEALAAGTPVIAFDRGANSEIIQDGVNGFLIAAGDLDGAARAVSQIAAVDQQRMAVDFQQRFSVGAFQSRLLKWFN